MAAIVTSFKQDATPVAVSREVFVVDSNDATSAVITPTKIKAIESAYFTPTNAAAATAATTNRLTITPGGATVTLTTATSSTFIVVVEGTIA